MNIDIGDSGLEIVQGYSHKMDEDTYLEEISLPGCTVKNHSSYLCILSVFLNNIPVYKIDLDIANR